MATPPDNFLLLEDVLLAQLEAAFATPTPSGQKVKILTAADLNGVAEEHQLTPAVHLVYQGYNITEPRHDSKAARIEQTWLTIVATTNKTNLKTGKAARSDAGHIAQRVIQALMGFKPLDVAKPLRLANAPAAGFNNGFQYLPLAFTAELVVGNV